MPARRTVLAALAATFTAGCSGILDDPASDAAVTPAPVVVSPVDARTVPDTATVGIGTETTAALEAATDTESADVTSRQWAEVLYEFGCFAFDGATYAIAEQQTGTGGYVNEYTVTEVEAPETESTVRVAALPDSDRRAVVDAIASGTHRYDSDAGGFDPNSSVYAYNNSYYVFSLETHADKPVQRTFVVEETSRDRCVTLESLPIAADRLPALDSAVQSADEQTVTGDLARTLTASDAGYIIRGGSCYALSAPVADTAS